MTSIETPGTSFKVDADYEEAVEATKIGKFNILLYLLILPGSWSSIWETTTMSYVFPVAKCDLHLTLQDIGTLNAITFLGMTISGVIWGYLSDTLGRKKTLVFGFLLDALMIILSGFSQSLEFLLSFKFLGGVIITGPFSSLVVYVSEFHSSKYRTKVQLLRGAMISTGTIVLPLLGWIVLPLEFKFSLFKEFFIFRSWNFFLFLCALPSLCSGLVFIYLPESPKYLMTIGETSQALDIFKKMYQLNTGNPKDSYPIQTLLDETVLDTGKHPITKHRTKLQALKEGIYQIQPLFFKPHFKNLVLVCLIQMSFFFSVNTLRLWIPQIFHELDNYHKSYNETSVCKVFTTFHHNSNSTYCFISKSVSVYKNSAIVSSSALLMFLIVFFTVKKVGTKYMLFLLMFIGGICSIVLYFAPDLIYILVLISLFLSMTMVGANLTISTTIDLFPTGLRTSTISILLMTGRIASTTGNFLFPLLFALGCASAFFTMGGILLCGSTLLMLLPNIEKRALI